MNTFLFLLTLLFTQNSWGFKINLLESTLELDKSSSTTATIINDSTSMIAIEAGARVRVYNDNGEEDFETLAENLIIIPSQMIIPPNGEQVLSIRWVGPKEIPKEEAYRLLIEYVSISEDKLKGKEPQEQQAGININYRIAKSFYVTPKGTKPKVTLQGAYKINVNGQEMLRLSFQNEGTKHQIVHNMKLQFTTNANTTIDVALSKEDLNGSINFLAKEARDIVVPWPQDLVNDSIIGAQILNLEPKPQ